uniref:Reverse transcriptase domain, reverse transcriptase zinc-binding domain protein n=1 Tax=Tanacetum cinerariifolium TaxID=118510 RepID=A0A6L2KNY0_TANCI|nr:reverse transcriptase domain, reverse transcriptase zinc-binding domain protein [Tanacetum cinerariifolium]
MEKWLGFQPLGIKNPIKTQKKRLGNFLEFPKRLGNFIGNVSNIRETAWKSFGGVSVPTPFPNGTFALKAFRCFRDEDSEYPFFEGDGSSSDEWRDYGVTDDDYEGPPVFDDDQYEEELMPVYDTAIESLRKKKDLSGKEDLVGKKKTSKTLLCKDRLPTRSNLDARGIDLDSLRCPVCKDDIESTPHLFVGYTVAADIWCMIKDWWGLVCTPNDLDGLLSWHESAKEDTAYQRLDFTRKRVFSLLNKAYPCFLIRCIQLDRHSEISIDTPYPPVGYDASTLLLRQRIDLYSLNKIEAEESDDPDDIAEIFKIEGNLFDYETPLCKAFNYFNYLLKINTDLFTFDIHGIRTYEKYELNNTVTRDLEEPCSDIDGCCNGEELPGMVRVGSMTYFQDHKWYDKLVDGELKEETLMHKAKVEELWGDATLGVMKFYARLKNSFENFHELDYNVLVKLQECWWKVNTHEVSPFTRWESYGHGPYANAKTERTYNSYLDINRIFSRNYGADNTGYTQDN